MAEAANTSLTTNFNVSPYYDDYDDSKNYYRILYKPGYAVQARELTQTQTILQKQIDRFGKHIFKEGSIVLPGNFNFAVRNTAKGGVDYVKVKDIDNANNDVVLENFQDKELVSLTTGVKGVVNLLLDGTELSGNTKTIYIDYTAASNSNSSITKFQSNDVLVANDGSNLVVVDSNPTGKASAFFITEGVLFAKEHFIKFPASKIILSRYNDNPTCQVGFKLSENIVSYQSDISLLDPALESSNYSAPGADRFAITPTLTVREVDDDEGDPDFVRLFQVKDGVVESVNDRPLYNILGDEIAKRTFDESGHYYTEGLNVSLRENLNDGTNGGYSLTGNSQLLTVQVSKGTAYVQGYERSVDVTKYITTEKSTSYETDTSQLASASMGSYVTVNELVGNWVHDIGTEIQLHDKLDQRITQKNWSSTTPSGNTIGTARLMAVEYNSGIPGTANGNYDVYLSDIKMLGSNSFSSVKSLYYDNSSTADIGADVVLTSGRAVLKDTSNFPMLYQTGSIATKTIKPNNISDTTFLYKQTTTVANVSSGTFTLPLPSGAYSFPYGTATLSSSQKREITLNLNSDANVSTGGTVSSRSSDTTFVGSGYTFTNLNVGDKIEFSGNSRTYVISSCTSTTVTVTETLPSTLSGNTIFKAYKTGDIIDLTGKGMIAGDTRTVSATPSGLSFDLKETLPGTVSGSLSYRVASEEAFQIDKQLRPDRFVKIDCSTAGTTGPFSLGFSDVYRIKEIRLRRDGSAITSNTEGISATSSFSFGNGQKDNMYDHAVIIPKISLTSNDRILVRLDYFHHDLSVGQGFFSVDSYPIDDNATSPTTIKTAQIPIYKSPSSGETYDLRNHLDFRPVKINTATDATTVATASENPTSVAAFNNDGNGARIPAPYSQISFDHEYYLSRKDVVYMDKLGYVRIEQGNPAVTPITPVLSDDKMPLAVLTITPYPSISPSYANILKRRDLASSVRKVSSIRFTMKDIGVLRDRIVNLENYVSLSLLEKNALDLVIQDENGLDRFKNGIFVDTFENHVLGATYNPDYRIVVDPLEKSIRPIFNTTSVYYDYLSGSNVVKKDSIVLLNYTEVPYFTQNAVTTKINTERTTYRYTGVLKTTPSNDVWVDTTLAPDETIIVNSDNIQTIDINDPRWKSDVEIQGGITTIWGSWSQYVSGYKVHRGDGSGAVVGTYSSLAEARTVANRLAASGSRATIETLYASQRTGTQSNYGTDIDSYTIGAKVINTSIIPYMRPQIIKVEVSQLKPYARYYPYFDGYNMSNNVVALSDSTSSASQVGLFGSVVPLVANSAGFVTFSMRIPNDVNTRFTTGIKEVKLTDSPTNDLALETSFAKNYFKAEGLNQTLQRSIISTRSVVRSDKNVSDFRNDPSTFLTIEPPVFEPQPWAGGEGCISYVFSVKTPSDEEGLFVSSVDVFVAEKHPTLGMWCEILECDDAGRPILSTLPFSVKTFTNSQIPISTNGKTNPLTVTFDAPVFLMANKSYAFVIHPEAVNPNYYLWAAKIGETDINTGNPVNSRLYKGTTYTTNNGIVWQILPDVDLVLNVKRASFVKNITGVVTLGNQTKEKLYTQNVSTRFTVYGEAVSNTTSGASGVLETSSYDGANSILELKDSNGLFAVGQNVSTYSGSATAEIYKIDDYRYSVVNFEPSFIKFNRTNINFSMLSYSNTGVSGSFVTIDPESDYYFTSERKLFSRSNEILDHSGNRTNRLQSTLRTSSDYVSPIIDLERTHSLLIDSTINNDATDETNATGGNLYNKYISKIVTLDENQDAEDMKVILTSYRPPSTDVKVWVKIKHSEDSDLFDSRPWIELERSFEGNILYSSISDRNDFKEYEYTIPSSYLTGSLGEVQYTQSNTNIVFTGYRQFSIKIGLLGTNSAVLPKVADLRVIALQV